MDAWKRLLERQQVVCWSVFFQWLVRITSLGLRLAHTRTCPPSLLPAAPLQCSTDEAPYHLAAAQWYRCIFCHKTPLKPSGLVGRIWPMGHRLPAPCVDVKASMTEGRASSIFKKLQLRLLPSLGVKLTSVGETVVLIYGFSRFSWLWIQDRSSKRM